MPETTGSQQPKLLDEVRTVLRLHHYSIHTERTYVDWIIRFVRFHRMRSRADLDRFMTFPATTDGGKFLAGLELSWGEEGGEAGGGTASPGGGTRTGTIYAAFAFSARSARPAERVWRRPLTRRNGESGPVALTRSY